MIHTRKVFTETIISQRPGNIVSDMDGEKVMLSIEHGKYYNLGELGGAVWDLIKEPVPVNSIITTLLSQYNVEQRECEEQVISFLDQLYEQSLITISHKR